MAALIDDIKQSFRQGTNLTKLIYINLAAFILIHLIDSIAFLFKSPGFELIRWFAVWAHLPEFITKPWGIVTYMFAHEGMFHILFNLVTFYFGGRIFEDLLGTKRLLSTYFLGGLTGGILFIVTYNLFPVFENILPDARMVGASGAVLAIVVAIATKAPNYMVNLFGILPLKLKYVAMFLVVIDLINFDDGNAGGHFAHLGGALYGFFYVRQLDKGRDWSHGFFRFMSALFSIFSFNKKSNLKTAYKNPQTNRSTKPKPEANQSTIDAILDKISKSGYDSLSREEKDALFKASQNK